MSVSANLNVLELTEGQSNKAASINLAISQIEGAVSGITTIDTSAATTSGDDVVIPFDETNDLSPRPALHSVLFRLSAGASADFNLIHPDNPHLFAVDNATTQTVTVKTAAGTGVEIETATSAICFCDGVNVITLVGASASATAEAATILATGKLEDFHVSVFDGLTANSTLAQFILPRDVAFAADFAGSNGTCLDPDTAQTVNVLADATTIGTISVDVAGAVTFATTGNIAQTATAGQVLSFTVGASPSGLDNLIFNLVGQSSIGSP